MKLLIFTAVAILTFCINSSYSISPAEKYKVTNKSGMVVTGVRISPNDANNWGFNLNVTGNVPAGMSFDFTQKVDNANCIYDIRYKCEDGKYYYIQDVDLCSSKTIILPSPTELEKSEE